MNRPSLLAVALAACVAFLAPPVAGQTPPAAPAAKAGKPPAGEPPMTADAIALQKAMLAKFPGAEIRYVAKTPYFGLYEVLLDDRIIYTDAKASQVIVGSIYDTESKENLTEDRQRKLTRVAWNDLPLNLAMKKVKGKGERKLAVFSDADCPFCARLENELKTVDNVTIYTFLYPIDQLHPDAARKSALIWCASDRTKAWDDYYANGKLPDNKGDCATPLAETQLLGQKMRVQATPTLVFADGSVLPGALPAAQLEAQLKSAEAEAKKLASAKK
jgi:thiol:disulfide interchange protein DsbC